MIDETMKQYYKPMTDNVINEIRFEALIRLQDSTRK